MSLKNSLNKLTSSPQGRKITDKAKNLANDPKTKAKIDGAKRKMNSRKGGTGGTNNPA